MARDTVRELDRLKEALGCVVQQYTQARGGHVAIVIAPTKVRILHVNGDDCEKGEFFVSLLDIDSHWTMFGSTRSLEPLLEGIWAVIKARADVCGQRLQAYLRDQFTDFRPLVWHEESAPPVEITYGIYSKWHVWRTNG